MIFDMLLSVGTTTWILASIVVLIAYVLTRRDDPNLPPSPGIALPFIGHGYLMKKNPVQQFRAWRKKIGDVFTLRLGKRIVVVINGYENLKHTLIKQADSVSDRPPSMFVGEFPDVHCGILTSSGANWKEQRTTALSILREFGMGKNVLAEKIAEEVAVYLSELKGYKEQPTDLRHLTNECVSNVICSIIFGKRFELDDPEFISLIDNFNEQVHRLSGSSILLFLPWLKKLPGDPFKWNYIKKLFTDSRNFVKKRVDTCLRDLDLDNISSFSSAYVREIEKKKDAGVSTYLDKPNLYRSINHLFIAGTETTSNTIVWCVLFILHNPHVQDQIYKEIVDKVGTDRIPTMSDKPHLRYLTATIMETQRLANILPLDLNHLVSAPMEVNGYTIPVGTTVIPCLDSVLLDEEIWGDPNNFRPERFLDKDGNIIKREELVPFSLGRRVCLGEALAKMELFLYLSAMFQRFQFLPVDPNNLPPIKEIFGATCPPMPFQVKCVERKA